MDNLYGPAYGLAKMGEGLSGGLARGTMAAMQFQREEEERQANRDYRNETLRQRQENLDLAKKTALTNEQREDLRLSAEATKAGLEAFYKTKNPEVFKVIYKSIYPKGEPPDISIGRVPQEIKLNWKGLKINGFSDKVSDAVDIISKNPDVTGDVLNQLVSLGFAEIEVPKTEEAKAPTTRSFKRGENEVTQEWDAITKTWKDVGTGPAFKPKEPKEEKIPGIHEYIAGIKAIGGKYQVDPGLGITLDASGNVTKFNMNEFMAGKETAYNIIQKKAQEGNVTAKEDLKSLDLYYSRIKDILSASGIKSTPEKKTPISQATGDAMSMEGLPRDVIDLKFPVSATPEGKERERIQNLYEYWRNKGKTPQEAARLANE